MCSHLYERLKRERRRDSILLCVGLTCGRRRTGRHLSHDCVPVKRKRILCAWPTFVSTRSRSSPIPNQSGSPFLTWPRTDVSIFPSHVGGLTENAALTTTDEVCVMLMRVCSVGTKAVLQFVYSQNFIHHKY